MKKYAIDIFYSADSATLTKAKNYVEKIYNTQCETCNNFLFITEELANQKSTKIDSYNELYETIYDEIIYSLENMFDECTDIEQECLDADIALQIVNKEIYEVYETHYMRHKLTKIKIYEKKEEELTILIKNYIEKAYKTECIFYNNCIYIDSKLANEKSENKDEIGLELKIKLNEIKSNISHVIYAINYTKNIHDIISYVENQVRDQNTLDSSKAFEMLLRLSFQVYKDMFVVCPVNEEIVTIDEAIEITRERCTFQNTIHDIFDENEARTVLQAMVEEERNIEKAI
ncbi:TPA: hypothetical protein ACPVZ9_001523 [Vibrio parahaemolyticus]